ncbi:MAG: hypothetical protein ACXVKA_08190 [Acidimicrobiia bacterium]
MEDQARRTRTDRILDRLVALSRRLSAYGRDVAHNPVRLLVGGVCIVLVVVALPLLIGGGMRLDHAWTDWRHERSVGRDWIRSTGHLTAVRQGDALTLRLYYFDRSGERHRARVQVEASSEDWIVSRMPIRYDPAHPSQVDLVNVAETNPLGSGLVAGASIGAGFAALILAFGIWRRRRALAESSHPFTTLRVPLAVAGAVLAAGMAAWAVGTVRLRGWSGVADRLGKQFSVVFGDLLGVTVPLVTFAIGCLLTAWLARHRHHENHEGILSRMHRLIDRAAGYVPSPEDLQAEAPDAGADETRTGAADAPSVPAENGTEAADDGAIRTG